MLRPNIFIALLLRTNNELLRNKNNNPIKMTKTNAIEDLVYVLYGEDRIGHLKGQRFKNQGNIGTERSYFSKMMSGERNEKDTPIYDSTEYWPFKEDWFISTVNNNFESDNDAMLQRMAKFCADYLTCNDDGNSIRKLVGGIVSCIIADDTLKDIQNYNTGYEYVTRTDLANVNRFELHQFMLDVWYKITQYHWQSSEARAIYLNWIDENHNVVTDVGVDIANEIQVDRMADFQLKHDVHATDEGESSVLFHGNDAIGSSDDKEKFRNLVDATYQYACEYRKCLNSNHSAEDEMHIIENLHSSVYDLYFYYEKNHDRPFASDAKKLVDAFNLFFNQLQIMIDRKNNFLDARESIQNTTLYFEHFVNLLLAETRA